MGNHNFDQDRRNFIKTTVLMGTLVGFWFLLPSFPAQGEQTGGTNQVVKPSDPMAQALGYNPNSDKVDSTKWPKHEKGQYCHTCTYFTKASKNQGHCQIFQGQLVQYNGWCNSWTKKG